MRWTSNSSGTRVFDGVEEATELRAAVATVHLADDFAGFGIESREPAGGAVTQIVMSTAFGLPGSHGQQRGGSLQSLNLALLIDTQDQSALGRVPVQAANFWAASDRCRHRCISSWTAPTSGHRGGCCDVRTAAGKFHLHGRPRRQTDGQAEVGAGGSASFRQMRFGLRVNHCCTNTGVRSLICNWARANFK